MWIGCVHPDRLLSYTDVLFKSGCWLPIRMFLSYPDVDFPSARIRRDVACPLGECAGEPRACLCAGSLDRGAVRLASGPCFAARRARVLNGPRQAGSSAQRSATGGLECSTVRVRRARARADNPRHHVWFPNNVARNSLVNISDFENASLELQRLWGVSKTDRYKLRATFGGREAISASLARDRRQPRARRSARNRRRPRAHQLPAHQLRQPLRLSMRASACAPATRAPTPPGQEKPATASSRRRTPTRPPPPTQNG